MPLVCSAIASPITQPCSPVNADALVAAAPSCVSDAAILQEQEILFRRYVGIHLEFRRQLLDFSTCLLHKSSRVLIPLRQLRNGGLLHKVRRSPRFKAPEVIPTFTVKRSRGSLTGSASILVVVADAAAARKANSAPAVCTFISLSLDQSRRPPDGSYRILERDSSSPGWLALLSSQFSPASPEVTLLFVFPIGPFRAWYHSRFY